MITNPFQQKAYDAVGAALPFAIDPAKITVEPGVSYLPSPIKLHDYAAGVMAGFGSVLEPGITYSKTPSFWEVSGRSVLTVRGSSEAAWLDY